MRVAGPTRHERAFLSTLRKPEFTGENRCVPCTVLNLGIAAIVVALVARIDPVLAFLVAIPMVASIYLRGYLIPGTPTITHRYVPAWILRHFDHQEQPETGEGFDAETYLLRQNAIREDRSTGEYVLDSSFETRWRAQYDVVREADVDEQLLANVVGVDAERLAIEWKKTGFVAWLDDTWIGQWEFRVAFLAYIAADAVMADLDVEWHELPLAHRSTALGVLRLFVERCPACDGTVALDLAKRRSCCRDIDVIATTCQACNVRLFEAPYDPDGLEGPEDEGVTA